MKLSDLERKIIIELYRSSDGLFIYSIFKRQIFSPGVLYRCIDKLVDQDYIIKNGDRLTLTEKAKKHLLSQHYIISNNGNNKYANIPAKFIAKKLEVNGFYLPNKNHLDTDILNL